jgi:hypothetical protein
MRIALELRELYAARHPVPAGRDSRHINLLAPFTRRLMGRGSALSRTFAKFGDDRVGRVDDVRHRCQVRLKILAVWHDLRQGRSGPSHCLNEMFVTVLDKGGLEGRGLLRRKGDLWRHVIDELLCRDCRGDIGYRVVEELFDMAAAPISNVDDIRHEAADGDSHEGYDNLNDGVVHSTLPIAR